MSGNLPTFTSEGIPDGGELRPICWRLLLNYLPRRPAEWPQFLHKQRSLYDELVSDLIAKPDTSSDEKQEESGTDHPLNEQPDSAWSTYFKDNEVLLQIDKDVRGCDKKSSSKRKSDLNDGFYADAVQDGTECHWEVVERILFIYYKLNPGVKYVQGMNEIIGPLYYVLSTGADGEYAEADTFFCFQNLLGEISDHFIRSLDDSAIGIESTMNRLYSLLKVHDAELHSHLTIDLELVPAYYAFRWISLMLSQEFLLPDVIQIWDSLFSDARRFELLIYICLAMLTNLRKELLGADFITAMKLLQNYPSVDVGQLVIAAIDSQKQDLGRGATV